MWGLKTKQKPGTRTKDSGKVSDVSTCKDLEQEKKKKSHGAKLDDHFLFRSCSSSPH